MRDRLPPYVKLVRSKGREYWYFQRFRGTDRAEKPIRLPDSGPRSPEFWDAYAAVCGAPRPTISANSVRAVIDAWKASPEWAELADSTKSDWKRYCDRTVEAWGDLDIRGIEPKHVLALRDRYASTPAAANNLIRCLSSFMSWSTPRGYRADNPCREIRMLKGGDPYEPWPWEMIELACETMPSRFWWFVALALYTGQRRGDVLEMSWRALRGDMIAVKQEKTDKPLLLPIHRDLRPVLDAIPRVGDTILVNERGRAWTGDGFSASWRKIVPKEIEERGLVLHGLRKSAVCFLLEAGATDAEVCAVTGQSREMVEHYSKQVNQAKLAAAALLKWEAIQAVDWETLGNRSVD